MAFYDDYKSPNLVMNSRGMRSPSPTSVDSSSEDNPLVLEQVRTELLNRTRELGPSHVKVAETWNSLGLIRLHMQRNAPAAMKCHEEALKIYRGLDDADPCQLADTLADLGRCCERLNEHDRALALYEEALRIVQAADVPDSRRRLFASTEQRVARLSRR